MVSLTVIFLALSLVSVLCAVRGGTKKRRNNGFILLSMMVAVTDVLCVALLNADKKSALNVFVVYYILHAWLIFAFLLMILLLSDRHRRFLIIAAVSAVICIYQTYLIISQKFGGRIFTVSKKIRFRTGFFVASDDSKNTGLLFSFRSYRIGTYLCVLLCVAVIIACIGLSHRIFRTGYYACLVLAIALCTADIIAGFFELPVWIPNLIYNIIPPFCLYLTGAYARNTLCDWSLDCFANDMSDGLILYDRHNDLIHTNDMIRNTLEESLIKSFEDRSCLEEWIREKELSGEKNVITYRSSDRDYFFKVNIRNLGDDRDSIGTLYIIHDTTDSVTRIMAVEKANQELERANRMKSDFLANMSHEIRTPMNAVIGMAELAIREKNSPQLEDYLRQIQGSGSNLLNIINDILDYSKIESGKMEIIEDEYSLVEELSDIANVLGTRVGEKPIELFVAVENALPRVLSGDAMRIRQVLINIANNAIKFTHKGMVKVAVRSEPLDDGRVNVIVHVTDTGIGIRKEDLDKLFVSFQQVDSKRNRSVEGTGLGLAISKRLVEAMGGTIGVESEYGKGSDFWFTVPQKVVDMESDVAVQDPSDKFAYVIDKEENTEMLGAFVHELGRFHVDSRVIRSPRDYTPTGRKSEILFFPEALYNDEIRGFLKEHKDVNGSVLLDLGSEFKPDLDNLHVMNRPEYTMNLVNTLNGKYMVIHSIDEEKVFRVDFIAPDARILIVDDNHINLTIAGGLLSPIRAKIDTADGGQMAIDMAAKNKYDIIFMDHMMPEVDGVDATKAIRAAGEGSYQPVIVALSANVMEEAKKLFSEAGMNDFVPKPVEVSQIITTTKKWLPADKIIERDPSETEEETGEGESGVRVNFEGIDTETAVRVLGSAALYDEIAGEYYRSGEEKLKSIEEAYDTGDWDNYTIRVHALKSSSRQIGAMELGNMAEALEKAGNAGDMDAIKTQTGPTLDEFRRILAGLGEYYGTEDENEGDKPLIDGKTLEDLLGRLWQACDDLDMDGMDEISDRLKEYSYGDDIRERIEDLRKAVANMDSEKCMEIIDGMK
ncbi:MAG: response regulator [Lachnospiraceae bacterium]|nr:response regulator [Lachnospiraceae bacterium]